MKTPLGLCFAIALLLFASNGSAQDAPDETDTEPQTPPEPQPSEPPPNATTPQPNPMVPPGLSPQELEEQRARAPRPIMSEGRTLVSLYNSGFQWGISPGVVFSSGKAGFFLGLRFGYGFDTGPVILVPGVRLAGYFTDPNVYVGMPTFKLIFPIDRFAPFIEGGVGAGHVTDPSKLGLALMGGGGFMIHFTRVAFGAEASYQRITGTDFEGIGVGPILALGF